MLPLPQVIPNRYLHWRTSRRILGRVGNETSKNWTKDIPAASFPSGGASVETLWSIQARSLAPMFLDNAFKPFLKSYVKSSIISTIAAHISFGIAIRMRR